MNKNQEVLALAKEFKQTEQGKRLYKINIISYIIYMIAFGLLIYVISNHGQELSTKLIIMIVISFILATFASLICSMYYFSINDYVQKNMKNKKK